MPSLSLAANPAYSAKVTAHKISLSSKPKKNCNRDVDYLLDMCNSCIQSQTIVHHAFLFQHQGRTEEVRDCELGVPVDDLSLLQSRKT